MAKQFVPFSARNAYHRAENVGAEGLTGPLQPKAIGKTAQSFIGITPAPDR